MLRLGLPIVGSFFFNRKLPCDRAERNIYHFPPVGMSDAWPSVPVQRGGDSEMITPPVAYIVLTLWISLDKRRDSFRKGYKQEKDKSVVCAMAKNSPTSIEILHCIFPYTYLMTGFVATLNFIDLNFCAASVTDKQMIHGCKHRPEC